LTDATSTASRRFLVTFALFLAVVVVLVVQAYLTIRELGEANRGSMQTYRVLSATVQMQEGLAAVEAGYRGYALTRAPRYLEQWQAGHTLFTMEAARLRTMVDEQAQDGQRLRTGVIERAFADFIRMQRASGVLDPATSRDEAIRAAGDLAGAARRSERVAEVRRELGAVETAESALLRERSARAIALERRTAVLVPAGFFLAIALALATAGMVQRRSRRVVEVNQAMQAEIAEKELARGALLRISRQNELILDAAARTATRSSSTPPPARCWACAPTTSSAGPSRRCWGWAAARGWTTASTPSAPPFPPPPRAPFPTPCSAAPTARRFPWSTPRRPCWRAGG